MVYKITFVQKQSCRGVLQKRCSANMKQTHKRTTMQKCDPNKAALLLLKSHPCIDASPQIRSTSAEHPPPGKCLWGTAFACQIEFQKNLFKVVKKNLLKHKINK